LTVHSPEVEARVVVVVAVVVVAAAAAAVVLLLFPPPRGGVCQRGGASPTATSAVTPSMLLVAHSRCPRFGARITTLRGDYLMV
jgi:hypothetical protein